MNYDDSVNNIIISDHHIENELIVKTEENNDDNSGLNFNQHNITVDELINIEKNTIENLGNNIEIMQNTEQQQQQVVVVVDDDECNVNKMAIESEIIVE